MKDDRQKIRLARRNAGKDRVPDPHPVPVGFVDSTIVMTRVLRLPLCEERVMPGEAQIFRVTLQAFGRRAAQRLMITIKIAGAVMNKFPAWPILGHGYGTSQLDPYMIRKGEKVEVSAEIEPASKWWVRWVDRIFDWWSPPKARVIVTGVVRGGESRPEDAA